MAYSLLQIAAAYDRPHSITCRHIKQLREQGKFVKKSPGKYYNAQEVRELEKLLQFKFPGLK